MPESAESMCQRVRTKREAAGLGADSVRSLMEAEFDERTSPQQLLGEECDLLVAMLEVVRRSPSKLRFSSPFDRSSHSVP